MKKLFAFALAMTMALTASAVRVHTLGDSLSEEQPAEREQKGWPQYLAAFLDNIEVVNPAKSGTSTKSFYKGYWTAAKANIQAGDYVIIQFSHNDENNGGVDADDYNLYLAQEGQTTSTDLRGTNPQTTYKEYLRKYVDEIRALGANPIISSAVCRLWFNNNKVTRAGQHDLGDKFNTLVKDGETWVYTANQSVPATDNTYDYTLIAQEIATEKGVPFINVTEATRVLFETYGEAQTKALIGVSTDGTHTCARGANMIAREVAALLRDNVTFFANKVNIPTDATANPASFELGELYAGVAKVNQTLLTGFGLNPTAGTATISAGDNLEVSLDGQSFSKSLNVAYTGGSLFQQIYIRANYSEAGTDVTNNVTIVAGGKTITIPVTGSPISLAGGSDVSATWALSSDLTAAATGITAADMMLSGMEVVSYAKLTNESVNMLCRVQNTNLCGIRDNKEECRGAWEAKIDVTEDRYIDFAVTAPTTMDVKVSGIHFVIAGTSTGNLRCRVRLGDGTTFGQAIYDNVTGITSNVETSVDLTPVYTIKAGETMHMRFWPWSNADLTLKYFAIRDVRIDGKAFEAEEGEEGTEEQEDNTVYTFGIGRNVETVYTEEAGNILAAGQEVLKGSAPDGVIVTQTTTCDYANSNATMYHGATTNAEKYTAANAWRNMLNRVEVNAAYNEGFYAGFSVVIPEGKALNVESIFGDFIGQKNNCAFKFELVKDGVVLYESASHEMKTIQNCGAANASMTVATTTIPALQGLTDTVEFRMPWWIASTAASGAVLDFNISAKIKHATTEEQPVVVPARTATWNWKDLAAEDEMRNTHVEGNTGTVASDIEGVELDVDATGQSGKLKYNSGANSAQFNQNTIIRVPVRKAGDVVTVISFPGYHNYTIAGTAATADTDTRTATAADETAGYIEIATTAGSYLYTIKVEQKAYTIGEAGPEPEPEPEYPLTATWDFNKDTKQDYFTSPFHFEGSSNSSGTVHSDVEGIEMTVLVNPGKFNTDGRTELAQFNEKTRLHIPVGSTNDVVKVTLNGGTQATVGGELITSAAEFTHRAYKAEAEAGYVEIVSLGGYLRKVQVILQGDNVREDRNATVTYYDVDGTTILGTQTLQAGQTIGTFAHTANIPAGYTNHGWVDVVANEVPATKVVVADMAIYPYVTKLENGKYIIPAGNGRQLYNTLKNAAEGSHFYLANGTYDLGNACRTELKSNCVLEGESRANTKIVNWPLAPGIQATSTIRITGNNVLIQHLTLRCEVSYATSLTHGVGVALEVNGDKSIVYDVDLQCNQDTYYSNGSADQRGYLKNCRIEGTVDYICGGGNIWFENTLLYNNQRYDGNSHAYNNSGDVIGAPATNVATAYGYVLSNCTIDGHSCQEGNYNLARPWQGSPAMTWLNTTCIRTPGANAYGKMTDGLKLRFHEYNTHKQSGTAITGHKLDNSNPGAGSDALYLTAVGNYTYENVVMAGDGWDPENIIASYNAIAPYTREIGDYNFGTICLPYAGEISADNGEVKLYDIAYKYFDAAENLAGVSLVELEGVAIEAGVAYIFEVEDACTLITVTQSGAKATAPATEVALLGTFVNSTVAAGNYIISGNEIHELQTTIDIAANRAYINMSAVPTPDEYEGAAPSRFFGVPGSTFNPIVTGVENTTAVKATKALVNGKLVIVRGAHTFNANGAMLK